MRLRIMAEKKEKQYVSNNARLMAEWYWEKNTDLDPLHLTIGSNKKVWWKCNKGHEWQATIYDRENGNGCPYCSGRYTVKGENDLQTINPTLAKEWNYEKNNGLTPMDVTPNSNRKVWWKCSKGHEWQAIIANRHRAGSGCPYCSGRCVAKGEKDLQTINPTLAKEWNYEKNNGLTPANVMPNSGQKIWWKCSEGHEWQARIADRNSGYGCPFCSGRKVLKGYNDLQTISPTIAQEWNYEKNGNLKPEDFTSNSNKKVWWKCSKGHEWEATISHRNNGRGCPICNSERHTSLPEYMIAYYLEKYGLEAVHSYKEQGYELDIYIPSRKVAIEYDGYIWHKDKTKQDLEKNIKCEKSGIKLYRLREGLPSLNDSSIDYTIQRNQKNLSKVLEEVLSAIIGTSVDVNLERDAIAIENLRVHREKEDSLLFSNPEVAKEWNYEKNGNLKPEHVSANSGKKVWWTCSKGHEWKAVISNRNKGHGCPYCAGIYVIKGENDLLTVNPTLAKEWNYEKNGDLKPENFSVNSGQKVWWTCNKGHEWEATIVGRNNGRGCPYCAGQKVFRGENDLKTVNPTLAREWNYEKNNGLTPMDIMPNSGKKVWWKCPKCGHSWEATAANRSRGDKCPACAGKVVIVGKNDLSTINPKLAHEWDNEKNGDLIPQMVLGGSNKKVWWICSKCSHSWRATIDSRNKGNGCPYCSGRYAVQGENDLLTLNPTLAKEWNYKKNGNLRPEDYLKNSHAKVWWICSKGHEWQATIVGRNKGSGCPYCSGREVVTGYNDLQTANPVLAKEWNYEKNEGLVPTDVLPNSGKKIWWKCNQGHEWEATIASRNKGSGCPYCSGRYVIKGKNDLQTVNPVLSNEWNYEKNNGLTPSDVTPNSHTKVWWKCNKGHEWEATIANRNNGRGCPYCSSKTILQGYNDLQTVNPTLAKEWNYEKNKKLTPSDVMPNSDKKVWWKCSKGHEWQASIYHRNTGRGCPECAKQKRKKS